MLKSIEINNYALIQHVRLDLHPGLTAITGETGSGKSIIMGALGLLLGDRADSKSALKSDAKCVVEASFDLHAVDLSAFFTAHDLDADIATTIRREITPAGKSRAFINDTPVSLQTLKEFGDLVIDIHSQHENNLITQRSFRYGLVDSFNQDATLFSRYVAVFQERQQLMRERQRVAEELDQLLKEQDFRLFQLQELEQANLGELDQTLLESERDELAHADTILNGIHATLQCLDDDQNGQLQGLRTIRQHLQKISGFSPRLLQFDARVQSLYVELKELSAELNQYADQVQANPNRLEQLQESLSLLYQLQHKHRVQTIAELRDLEDSLRSTTQSTQSIENRLTEMDNQLLKVQNQLQELSTSLTKQRSKSAEEASTEIRKWFQALGLDHAQISFALKPSVECHAMGADEIEWLFSANEGVALQPLSKVASGGEIARVMLAIKATLSQRKSLPILILDEIDQGVSGEVGKKIGHVLKSMSTQMQLLTITHLAQIAGQADHQFKVAKQILDGQTTTLVKPLNDDERIEELAEMISGKTKSEAALANARELLN